MCLRCLRWQRVGRRSWVFEFGGDLGGAGKLGELPQGVSSTALSCDLMLSFLAGEEGWQSRAWRPGQLLGSGGRGESGLGLFLAASERGWGVCGGGEGCSPAHTEAHPLILAWSPCVPKRVTLSCSPTCPPPPCVGLEGSGVWGLWRSGERTLGCRMRLLSWAGLEQSWGLGCVQEGGSVLYMDGH